MPTASGAMKRAIEVSRWMPSTTAQLSSSSWAMWNDEIGMRNRSDSMSLLCWTSLQMPARRWKSGARSIIFSRSRESSRSTVLAWVSILMLSGSNGNTPVCDSTSSAGCSSSTPVGNPSDPISRGLCTPGIGSVSQSAT